MGKVTIVNQIEEKDVVAEDLKQRYPTLFSDKIGKLKDRLIKLHINQEIKPIRQRYRPESFHLREGINKAIQTMLDNDVIEKVNSATPWVSPIVPIVKENGDIRVCTDAKLLNTAIEREVHNCPTVDEIALELNDAKFISKLDLNAAYNQLELHPDSRDITVFSTHIGLFRYKRLNFGIKSAAEIFQKTIESVVQGISNCRNISDDIIVFGNTQEIHDKTLHEVLQRLEVAGLTLNVSKCAFNQRELDFFGLHFSQDGIRLKQSKIDALMLAGPPKDVKQLKSLYGLFSYASKFIKDAATLLTPFRELLKRGAKFTWTSDHDVALD
jgi:hypothetical protein